MKNDIETRVKKDLENSILKIMKEEGIKLKQFEIVGLIKNRYAYTELQIKDGLERLLEQRKIKKTETDEYLTEDI